MLVDIMITHGREREERVKRRGQGGRGKGKRGEVGYRRRSGR